MIDKVGKSRLRRHQLRRLSRYGRFRCLRGNTRPWRGLETISATWPMSGIIGLLRSPWLCPYPPVWVEAEDGDGTDIRLDSQSAQVVQISTTTNSPQRCGASVRRAGFSRRLNASHYRCRRRQYLSSHVVDFFIATRSPTELRYLSSRLATRTIEAGLHLGSAGRGKLRQARRNFSGSRHCVWRSRPNPNVSHPALTLSNPRLLERRAASNL
jgi:hypothetical protein